jgi:1-acyl-sn-glycerol-3-phosphate acyltransferase
VTWLAERYLTWRGWRFLGRFPDIPKMIVIGAPHTSNWDFVLFLGAVRHWRIRPKFIGKHTLFRAPFGGLFRRWGGIPVDRTKTGGLVGQVASSFEAADELILVISPEGTRHAAEHWKSGFVQIAAATGAPLVPVYVDYRDKEVVIGEPVEFEGDERELMDRLRLFYANGVGKHTAGQGPVRLNEETTRS